MGFGGGGGNAQIDTAAQERQFELERQRIALQQQAEQARQSELEILRSQLQEQQTINQEQVSLLQGLNEQSIQASEQFASLLNESTALARRQGSQAEDERLRAAAASDRARLQSGFNPVQQQRRQQQSSTLYSPSERLSILSSVGI